MQKPDVPYSQVFTVFDGTSHCSYAKRYKYLHCTHKTVPKTPKPEPKRIIQEHRKRLNWGKSEAHILCGLQPRETSQESAVKYKHSCAVNPFQLSSTVTMLHALKRKTVGGIQARHEPKNAEFDNLRQRLDNVQKALTNSLDSASKAEKSWIGVTDSAQNFCEGLHSLYPQDDAVRILFKKTLDDASALQKEVKHGAEAASNVKSIERMVRGYLAEIKTLKTEYPRVEAARKDFGMYHRKVERLGSQNTKKDDKRRKFLDLLENSKATYDSILDGIIHRMRTTYDKSPTMFRAAYVAYWLSQLRIHSAVSRYYQPALAYAAENESNLFAITQTAHARLSG